ncbi:MAG: hypothetical protein SFV54_09375 [Bryobacteraceae bacterium]|nr:hypothetical protein [Bryobacteraceae bacterium]
MAASAVPSPAPTSAWLLDVLERVLHANGAEWVFQRELRVGTGRRPGSLQRVDAFALNCYPHTGMKRICYEVKTSRADFLGELKQPLKRRIGMRYSNEFYFVTPGGLVSPREIPSECGLIEIGCAAPAEWKQILPRQAGFFHYAEGVYTIMTVPAPWRDTPGPTWQFLAAMLRNQRRELSEKPPPPPQQGKLTFDA